MTDLHDTPRCPDNLTVRSDVLFLATNKRSFGASILQPFYDETVVCHRIWSWSAMPCEKWHEGQWLGANFGDEIYLNQMMTDIKHATQRPQPKGVSHQTYIYPRILHFLAGKYIAWENSLKKPENNYVLNVIHPGIDWRCTQLSSNIFEYKKYWPCREMAPNQQKAIEHYHWKIKYRYMFGHFQAEHWPATGPSYGRTLPWEYGHNFLVLYFPMILL